MTGERYSLVPFAPEDFTDIHMTSAVWRAGSTLYVDYTLQGGLASVRLPAPEEATGRKHGLWQDTCMECFLAVEPGSTYWEFNLSPSGQWNVYRFTGYREGMAEEAALSGLSVTSARSQGSLALSFETDLSRLVAREQPLLMNLSAVVRLNSGRLTYWALTHPGRTPDFHRRDSFIVNV